MEKLIDLSLPVGPGMHGIAVSSTHTLEKEGWNAADWSIYSHACTHADAPIHFGASPETIDRMPLELFYGPAWIAHIDNVEPRQLLMPADLGPVADSFEPGGCLLLDTGWSQYVSDPAVYRDGLPRISEALANWCVDKEVKLLGVEPPSVADVNNLAEVRKIHLILLGARITIVEGLCNLDRLGTRSMFMALPLKLQNGDGGPVRAVAFS
ncbi:MAG: cyclase family protein [Opitutae bacterium]|nr:cyclase family protein [Opitutae bacterium]